MASNPLYRGRFAPSPTGPLHLGSLVAALGSYLDARRQEGAWLLRLEDLDTARNEPEAEAAILQTLEAYGLHWDGPVMRQSEHVGRYEAVLEQLIKHDLAYPCRCSRKTIVLSTIGHEEGVYPGTCYTQRMGSDPKNTAVAFRFHVNPAELEFEDRLQGVIRQNVVQAAGDFVIRRADGPFAYQLAVVVVDAAQGITHVVRGLDLLDSTPRQIALQRALGYNTPTYLHLPLLLNAQGEKLSKQTKAPAVGSDPKTAARTLHSALRFLGITVPRDVEGDIQQMLHYAVHNPNKDLLN
jgi:glutamyl-Q tRNA(Asp) synthetase